METELSPYTEEAAELFEVFGPLAAALAMLYKRCLELEMTERLAEHFVISVMDGIK